jgi:hypothetical protein
MANEVEDKYVALATTMIAGGKDHLARIRRPARLCLLPTVLDKNPLLTARCGWNSPCRKLTLRRRRRERELGVIWLPSK